MHNFIVTTQASFSCLPPVGDTLSLNISCFLLVLLVPPPRSHIKKFVVTLILRTTMDDSNERGIARDEQQNDNVASLSDSNNDANQEATTSANAIESVTSAFSATRLDNAEESSSSVVVSQRQSSPRQSALRHFATDRSHSSRISRNAAHGSSRRTVARSLSSETAHQLELRKQAHLRSTGIAVGSNGGAPPASTPGTAGIQLSNRFRENPSNDRSSGLSRVDTVMTARDRPGTLQLQRMDMPESLESSPMNVNSGWMEVETTRGAAGGAPPCQRSLHAAAVLNNCLYVFGGYDGQARVNDFHCFSFVDKRWSPVLASAASGVPPSPRDRHVAVVHGNSFYVFGGFDGTSRINDFFGFDFSSMSWREVLPLTGEPPSPRHSHAAVVYGDSMFVFGGYDGSYRSDFHEYDFGMNKWNIIPPAGRPPRARYRATCTVHKTTMILFGGHDGTRHLSDTHTFDFETRIWSTLVTEGIAPMPRDSHVSVVHGDSMFVFGGSTGSAMNDLHELQISSSASAPAKWRAVSTSGTNEPGHRFCHVGSVYGDAMYVFGGYDGSARLNDFIKFEFTIDDLSFEVPPSTIISDLRSFINDDGLSDVTFIVEGQSVFAHKIMLTRCSYFRAMFLGEMMESNQSTINIEQVSYPIFLAILEYLYTDKVHILLEDAMDLFVAADLFCIPRLQTMCEKKMLQSITIENAATIFHAADVHSAVALRLKSLKYILAHFEAISKTSAFEEMARCNVELVFEILQQR